MTPKDRSLEQAAELESSLLCPPTSTGRAYLNVQPTVTTSATATFLYQKPPPMISERRQRSLSHSLLGNHNADSIKDENTIISRENLSPATMYQSSYASTSSQESLKRD